MDIRPYIILIIAFFPAILMGQQDPADTYIYTSGDLTIISNAERTEGIHYKVEVVRLANFNPNDPELERLKNYGNIYTETLDKLELKSLLIGPFEQLNKANEIKKKLKDLGFTEARVVKYNNGLRQP